MLHLWHSLMPRARIRLCCSIRYLPIWYALMDSNHRSSLIGNDGNPRMNFVMAIPAYQNALVEFSTDRFPWFYASAHCEILRGRINVVKFQCSMTPIISTYQAFSALIFDCLFFNPNAFSSRGIYYPFVLVGIASTLAPLWTIFCVVAIRPESPSTYCTQRLQGWINPNSLGASHLLCGEWKVSHP